MAEDQIKDYCGYIGVTLILQCALQGITLEDALEHAYGIISKRTGKMVN